MGKVNKREVFILLLVLFCAAFLLRIQETAREASAPEVAQSHATSEPKPAAQYALFVDKNRPHQLNGRGSEMKYDVTATHQRIFPHKPTLDIPTVQLSPAALSINRLRLGEPLASAEEKLGPTLTQVYQGEPPPSLFTFGLWKNARGENTRTLVGVDKENRIVYLQGAAVECNGRRFSGRDLSGELGAAVGAEKVKKLHEGSLQSVKTGPLTIRLQQDGEAIFELGEKP